jgi:Secretion system C-terminal sorting domain
MNRSLLFIFLLIFGLQLSAQYSQSPAVTNIFTVPTREEYVLDVVYTASSDTNLVYWKFEKASTFDPAWEFFVCDLNLCYGSTIERCPPSKPNTMKIGNNLFQYHFKPHNTEGVSTVTVKFYADKNLTQETHSTVININVSETVSTKDLNNINNLKVYPNPATDYFQLSNAVGVKKIVVYNMFGKEVKSYFHYPNAQHEISELKTGMYIVKLLNDKNKVIKSVKLNKSYSGV